MKALSVVFVLILVTVPSSVLSQEPTCTTVTVMDFVSGSSGADSLAQALPQMLVRRQPQDPTVCWRMAGPGAAAAGEAPPQYMLVGSVLALDSIRVDWRLVPVATSKLPFRGRAVTTYDETTAEIADRIVQSVLDFLSAPQANAPGSHGREIPPPTTEYIAEMVSLSTSGARAYPRDSVGAEWLGTNGFLVTIEKEIVRADTIYQIYGYGYTVEEAARQCMESEALPSQDTTRVSGTNDVAMACAIGTSLRVRQCERANGTWRTWEKGFLCERKNTWWGAYGFEYQGDEAGWLNTWYQSGWKEWR